MSPDCYSCITGISSYNSQFTLVYFLHTEKRVKTDLPFVFIMAFTTSPLYRWERFFIYVYFSKLGIFKHALRTMKQWVLFICQAWLHALHPIIIRSKLDTLDPLVSNPPWCDLKPCKIQPFAKFHFTLAYDVVIGERFRKSFSFLVLKESARECFKDSEERACIIHVLSYNQGMTGSQPSPKVPV